MMDLTREYYKAVRDCTVEDCGDCILRPATNRACYTVDVDPGKEARMILGLMDERDALLARVAELEAENKRLRKALTTLIDFVQTRVLDSGPDCDCDAAGHICGWPAWQREVRFARAALEPR